MNMIERAMPANFGGPVRALTTDQAVGADVFVELPAPEKVP